MRCAMRSLTVTSLMPCRSANARSPSPRHRAVVGHDLADHAGRVQSRQPRQIHRRFGLSRAHQHAAVARAQRERVPRAARNPTAASRIHQRFDRRRAILRRNSRRRDAARLHRDGKRGFVDGRVVVDHLRATAVRPAAPGQRDADEAAASRRMKLIASGVIICAAMTRSPSFSRSSSSSTTTILPARMSAIASSIESNGERGGSPPRAPRRERRALSARACGTTVRAARRARARWRTRSRRLVRPVPRRRVPPLP